ncbi:MAG TPA: LUD domain-containing protein [Mucilaginibacter sp.]|jgi:L-lactate dehydrogenase complex protein LldG
MSQADSKEWIIKRIGENKPGPSSLPDISHFETKDHGSTEKFSDILKAVGGSIYYIHDFEELVSVIGEKHGKALRLYSPIPEIQKLLKQPVDTETVDGHDFENVEVAIINAHFGVAENGAVWVSHDQMGNRAVPFICQHLAVIINEDNIVPTMHEAYHHRALRNYNYGAFIAGPSKTADIEQSLVLGAHGPKSMTVFVLLVQKHY